MFAVAVAFHQLNEGFAIGLAFLSASYSTRRYFLLGATFMFTTPVGVAIGIAIGHSNYSATMLLGFEGVMNSFSAGILLYNGLVDLIVPTFKNSHTRSAAVESFGFVSLFAGAGVMSLIGVWA